ncbi:IS701 family transposase, partial [Frankia sp. CcWB2]
MLEGFRPCFTAPTFRVFRALVVGMLAATGRRTVRGMLVGAGLSRTLPHDRAHRFFAAARWDPNQLGLALARLVVRLLAAHSAPVLVAVDDTLFTRTGKKVWAAGWFHDGSARDSRQIGFGNNWVIVGIVVTLPMLDRPVCLPVLARLVRKDTTSASRLWLAARAVEQLAAVLPGRRIHVVADAAYAGDELRTLPSSVTWTTRLRKDAALFAPAPPRTGKRGRPRLKGDRLGTLTQLATTETFVPVTVVRYGQTVTVHVAAVRCLWYG